MVPYVVKIEHVTKEIMSCLFNSVGQLLGVPTETVRRTICDYLAGDHPVLDGMKTSDVLALESPQYIQRMRQSSTWGGAIEIQTIVRIWNVNVTVQNRRDGTSPIEFVTPGIANGTLTLYWTGNHYEPVDIRMLSSLHIVSNVVCMNQ